MENGKLLSYIEEGQNHPTQLLCTLVFPIPIEVVGQSFCNLLTSEISMRDLKR